MTDLGPEDTRHLSMIAAELRDALNAVAACGRARAEAEAAHKFAYLTAHAESTTLHPDRKVDEHKTAAEISSFDLWADANAAKYAHQTARERAHTLRQILMAKQTELRAVAEASGVYR